MATTYEEVLDLMRILVASQQDTDRKFQETDRKFQETERLLKPILRTVFHQPKKILAKKAYL